jgi:arylsulfatase A-like enzyme
MIKIIIKTFCFLAIIAYWVPAQAQEKPDILFIAVDDLNDWVGVLGGHPQSKTPNIDALAARGMLFTNAHTVGAACLPARTSILTGVTAFNSGIYTQVGDWRNNPRLEGVSTLPKYFKDNDYLTKGAGKLFHAHTYGVAGFVGQQDVTAWDDYYPSLARQLPDEVRPASGQTSGAAVGEGIQTGGFDFYPTLTEDYAMGDGQVVNWIGRQLEAESTGPRFISAGLFRPHLPWYVPQKYFDMHPVDEIILPEYLESDWNDIPDSALRSSGEGGMDMQWIKERGTTKWQQAVQGYLASISFADTMVGEIIAALDRSGRADNTIIVLWADHGYQLGQKDHLGKETLYEEVTHVPFIVVAPGITIPGSSTNEVVSTQSIYATLTELAGLERPAHVDGTSLVPLLQNPDMAWDDVAITTYGPYGNFTVRDDRYRYIVYADGQEELYDHDNDPNEWNNLANNLQYQEIKAGLSDKLPPAEEHAPAVQFGR